MKKTFLHIMKDPDKLVWLIVLLNLIGSLIFFWVIGPDALSSSDDVGYLDGGRFFVRSGYLAVWENAPTAAIMPAMAVITGLAASIFGEGTLYIASVKLLFILLGCLIPLFFYRGCTVFIPKWYALLTACAFLCPTHLWANGLVLTETPYLLFSTMCLYYTFQMGRSQEKKFLWRYCLSFLLALSFRANIVTMPIFTWIYLLLIRKYSIRELLRRLGTLVLVSMVLILPWTIRNYIQFQAFIPLTYGTYHPVNMGTYEGYGCPPDEELDYVRYVDEPFMEDYGHYFNEDGSCKDPEQDFFLGHMRLKYKAEYRISQWMERDLPGFLYSYLIYKPMSMLNWVWYWGPADHIVLPLMGILGKINLLLCGLGLCLSWILKQKREILLYLLGMYGINTYILATATVTARYASMNLPLRYMAAGVGIWLMVEAVRKLKTGKKEIVS